MEIVYGKRVRRKPSSLLFARDKGISLRSLRSLRLGAFYRRARGGAEERGVEQNIGRRLALEGGNFVLAFSGFAGQHLGFAPV